MKAKFSGLDICAAVHDLKRLIGMRVINVYDIDSKTYLVKLHKPTDKAFILFESGVRIHVTTHDWAKAQMPSGFSMKFRKHIRQRRLINVTQIGADRIIDMTFGEEHHACHVIVELYDRGNLVLTDSEYKILNVLRPRTDKDHDVRFSVKETYPLNLAWKETFMPSKESISLFLKSSQPTSLLRKSLVKHVPFSGQLLEHAFLTVGLPSNAKVEDVGASDKGVELLARALTIADDLLKYLAEHPCKGYIIYKKVKQADGIENEMFEEYSPILFAQFNLPNSDFSFKEFSTFSESVDAFYSQIDTQKIQQKSAQMENEAIRKLDNVKRDHEKRLKALDEVQHSQQKRAELIVLNRELVDKCLTVIRQALANKMAWDEIQKWIHSATSQGNQLAKTFVRLNLSDNTVILRLSNPYEHLDDSSSSDESEVDDGAAAKKKAVKKASQKKDMEVELNLDLNADQNSRQHFTERKVAAIKQQKTLQSSNLALKNAQKQAQNKVKQVRTNTTLARARKAMWFEKFYWCISSDGYLIIGGRDAQQNEMIVKRYLRPGDIYVHADLPGASSVVVRNKTKVGVIPPMTLNEAGTMAICYSNAWEAKIVVSAWWVHHEQVSRTAPTGEYLTAGSFMIRGKKNFLPCIQLQLGFGLMFKLDEESTERCIAELKERQSTRTFSITAGEQEEERRLEEENVYNDDDDTVKEVELNKDGRHIKDEEERDLEDNEEDDEFPDVEVNLESLNVHEENDDLILESLTSDPKFDDGLLFIVAVCGPYSAMQKFKYKVKITPGTGKRGKAVKSAFALFQSDKSATPAERALVKLLASDPAIIQQLPSKVNVLAPQLMRVKK